MKHYSPRFTAGFTLIELLVTIAIIGILAAVAIPNYTEHVRRSALSQAFSDLSDMRIRLEQFYQNNRNYGDVAQVPPCGHDGTASRVSFAGGSGNFTYGCVLDGAGANVNQSYTLTATGAAGAAIGHVFTLNSANTKKTTTFKSGVVDKSCWLSKGSEC